MSSVRCGAALRPPCQRGVRPRDERAEERAGNGDEVRAGNGDEVRAGDGDVDGVGPAFDTDPPVPVDVEGLALSEARLGTDGCARPIGPATIAVKRLSVTVRAKSLPGPPPADRFAGPPTAYAHWIVPAEKTPAPESTV